MRPNGVFKRCVAMPSPGRLLHEKLSKSTIHEALLDLWLEHNGLDVHPSDMTPEEWAEYEADVRRRSEARQRAYPIKYSDEHGWQFGTEAK